MASVPVFISKAKVRGQTLAGILLPLFFVSLLLMPAHAQRTAPLTDADWIPMSSGIPGANDVVYASACDAHGNLYFAGIFTFIANKKANIAKWDGTNWTTLATNLGTGYRPVYALTVVGTNVYAGGWFTNIDGVVANYIARWDGASWYPLGTGTSGTVWSLAAINEDLYVAGTFTVAGGVTVNNIARWDGASWYPVGSGTDAGVGVLTAEGGSLYAGGGFANAGGIPANRIAKWNGSTWSALGTGMAASSGSSDVRSIAVVGTNVYAGGYFTIAGGNPANHIARWDGATWTALGTGVDWGVRSVAVMGTNLYASRIIAPIVGGYIAKWDNSSWSGLGSGVNDLIETMTVSGTNLFVGGSFTSAGGIAAMRVAKWSGTNWLPIHKGIDREVHALLACGTNLYVGGRFTSIEGVAANGVAVWNGRLWSPLGSGMGAVPYVYSIAASGSNIYVSGGTSNNADVVGIYNTNWVARWNGVTWTSIGNPMTASALATRGTNLYAATPNGLLRWNGTANSWSTVGTLSYSIASIAMEETNIFVGPSSWNDSVAKWDGNTWTSLPPPLSYRANSLAICGTNLYAGTDTALRRWNGAAWERPYYGGVFCLASTQNDLYAAGISITLPDRAVTTIAKWNGAVWTSLGSGTSYYIKALTSDDKGHLYAGGAFYYAGTNASPFLAQWNLFPRGGFVQDVQSSGTARTISCQGMPGRTFAIQRAGDAQFQQDLTTMLTTNAPTNGVFNWTDPIPPPGNGFYRLRSEPAY